MATTATATPSAAVTSAIAPQARTRAGCFARRGGASFDTRRRRCRCRRRRRRNRRVCPGLGPGRPPWPLRHG
eukprot:4263106-Pyramimonas_sp.AAC.1